MMRMMFHQYSKGRVLFTSSPSARVKEDRPEWLLTRTTTTMTMMCSRRLWARWRILGEGQMLESNERLFLLTVKILIRVQERNSSCLNIFFMFDTNWLQSHPFHKIGTHNSSNKNHTFTETHKTQLSNESPTFKCIKLKNNKLLLYSLKLQWCSKMQSYNSVLILTCAFLW